LHERRSRADDGVLVGGDGASTPHPADRLLPRLAMKAD
jgi:hypothetical protein